MKLGQRLTHSLIFGAVVTIFVATATDAFADDNSQYPAVPPYPMTQSAPQVAPQAASQTMQQAAPQQFSPQTLQSAAASQMAPASQPMSQAAPQQMIQPQMMAPAPAPIASSTTSNNGYQTALPPISATASSGQKATATATVSTTSIPATASASTSTQPTMTSPSTPTQVFAPPANMTAAPQSMSQPVFQPTSQAISQPTFQPTSQAGPPPMPQSMPQSMTPPTPGSNLTAAPAPSMQQVELQAFNAALNQQASQLQQTERDQAFRGVMQQAMPLTPEQILQLKYLYSQTQRASQAPPGIPPVPTSTTELVNLAPGAVPPVVRLSQGFITSLVFVDATGAPWPIAAYDLGNPTAFNIQWDKKNNILMIQSKDAYTYGNLAVKLQDLPTPVMVTLIPGQQVVDYRVDMRVQQMGPQAKVSPTGSGLPGQADPVLLGILDGVPPAGSKALQVYGGQAQAWSAGGKLLLRTRMTVISPGWIATMSSADGTNAYLLQNTPTILVSDNGALEQLRIEGLDVNGSNQ